MVANLARIYFDAYAIDVEFIQLQSLRLMNLPGESTRQIASKSPNLKEVFIQFPSQIGYHHAIALFECESLTKLTISDDVMGIDVLHCILLGLTESENVNRNEFIFILNMNHMDIPWFDEIYLNATARAIRDTLADIVDVLNDSRITNYRFEICTNSATADVSYLSVALQNIARHINEHCDATARRSETEDIIVITPNNSSPQQQQHQEDNKDELN